MSSIKNLIDYSDNLLEVARFKDYCPNGLQVEGKTEVQHLVSGVTASLALLEAAQDLNADCILVHHGYFWRHEPPQITGIKRARLAFLLRHQLNLLAYHLPLDAHPVLGNNVQLGKRLGFIQDGVAGDMHLLAFGSLLRTMSLSALGEHVRQSLGRSPLVLGEDNKLINRVAWCTGAAQGQMEAAIALGVDAFVSGEVSEQTTHLARESGVAYISAGHHATERYGVQALGEHLAQHFGLRHSFVDIDNPV